MDASKVLLATSGGGSLWVCSAVLYISGQKQSIKSAVHFDLPQVGGFFFADCHDLASELFSIFKNLRHFLFSLRQRILNMRLVVVIEFHLNALREIREALLQHLPIPLSERQCLQLCGGPMDPEVPLVEAEVEPADYGPLAES